VINANSPRVLNVDVRVEGTERVKTPLGTFETWKLRFQPDNDVFYLWIERDAPHRVIQAKIEDATFQITGP
jgi:hypothetical protein